MRFYPYPVYAENPCTLARRGSLVIRIVHFPGGGSCFEHFRLQSPARAQGFLRRARRSGWFRAVARYKWAYSPNPARPHEKT